MCSGIEAGFCWAACLGFPFQPDLGLIADCCFVPTTITVGVHIWVLASVRLILEKKDRGEREFSAALAFVKDGDS